MHEADVTRSAGDRWGDGHLAMHWITPDAPMASGNVFLLRNSSSVSSVGYCWAGVPSRWRRGADCCRKHEGGEEESLRG